MAFMKTTRKSNIVNLYLKTLHFLEKFVGPFLMLGIRAWMAQIFWYSGLSKIQSWSSTLMLFENEYKVPLLPPDLAAYLTVTIELTCPIFLFIGLGARLSVIPLLAMTAVIQFTYLNSNEHVYWALLLGTILCYGAGPISLDTLVRRCFCPRDASHRAY